MKSVTPSLSSNAEPSPTKSVKHLKQVDFINLIYSESLAMAKYALSNGLEVPADAIQKLYDLRASQGAQEPNAAQKITSIHQELSRIVRPATPRTIQLLDYEKTRQPLFYLLGPVPLIRQLSCAAIGFLVLLLGVSLNHNVNVMNIQKGLLNSDDSILFLNQIFILSCAGLGASFSALFLANRYIANATYDPRYDSTYWSRIILGVIAGMILVELLPASLFSEGNMRSFGKPSLAMFGGFSANVVYRIIERIVDSLETLVKGNSKSYDADKMVLMQAQASEQRTSLNAEVAAKLIELQNDLKNTDEKTATKKLNDFIKDLLPGSK